MCLPESPYGTAKLCAEAYGGTFSRQAGLEFVALRYANVYGPRQDPHGEAGVVAIFAVRLIEGTAPVINGDGTQTRDYVHVARRGACQPRGDRRTAGVYNIGTGVETDVNTSTACSRSRAGSGGDASMAPRSPVSSGVRASTPRSRVTPGVDAGISRSTRASKARSTSSGSGADADCGAGLRGSRCRERSAVTRPAAPRPARTRVSRSAAPTSSARRPRARARCAPGRAPRPPVSRRCARAPAHIRRASVAPRAPLALPDSVARRERSRRLVGGGEHRSEHDFGSSSTDAPAPIIR